MVTDLPGMVGEMGAAAVLVLLLEGFEVGHQRRLGVDHDVLLVGELDDQVGTESPPFGGDARLFEEVAVVV